MKSHSRTKYFDRRRPSRPWCPLGFSTLGDQSNVYSIEIDGTTSGDNFDANLIGWDNWFEFSITIASPGISFNEALILPKKLNSKVATPPLKKSRGKRDLK